MHVIKAEKTPEARRETFAVEVKRDDKVEQHEFTAKAQSDMASLSMAIKSDADALGALQGMLRVIRKGLVDDDGVPANWKPLAPQVDPAAPSDDEPDEGFVGQLPVSMPEPDGQDYEDYDEPEAVFVAPDGSHQPFSELDRYTDFAAGSSRRRWTYLMESDEDVVVEASVLKGMFEKIVRLGANRPTRRSS
jgi:hypothetical protein